MKLNTFPIPDDENYLLQGNLDNVPGNVSFLAENPNTPLNLSNIQFKWHKASQHLTIKNVLQPSYYDDYVMTASCSEKMQRLQQQQVEMLMEFYMDTGGGAKSLLEIGCGDGSFLRHARQKISRCLGIEPSQRFANEALRQGLDVLVGYVRSDTLLTTEKFDIFASRQVFEHLVDPLDVLLGIRQMLNPGAVGLIEVPNGQRALRMQRFFEFFPDHVNYYSVNSLVHLASDAGLNVLRCSETFGGDYLELWVRNEPDVEQLFSGMRAHRDTVCTALINTINEITSQDKRLIIWGAGAKTLSILSACPSNLHGKIAGVIDSDPHKHGLFVPNSSLQVFSPDLGSALMPDVVLILALSYREEISSAIRHYIPSCSLILTLDDHGEIATL